MEVKGVALMPRNYILQDKIDDEFMFLIDDAQNSECYEKLINSEHVSVKADVKHSMPASYDLIRVNVSEEQFVIALVDHTTKSIAYYIRANVWEDVFLHGKPVTQVLLWRTSNIIHKSVTSGLPQDVFFNYLLDTYNIVASDSHQTTEGRNFWIDKLGEAMMMGFHVYRYHRLHCNLFEIVDHADVRTNRCDLWGDDEDYQNVLALITKNEVNK